LRTKTSQGAQRGNSLAPKRMECRAKAPAREVDAGSVWDHAPARPRESAPRDLTLAAPSAAFTVVSLTAQCSYRNAVGNAGGSRRVRGTRPSGSPDIEATMHSFKERLHGGIRAELPAALCLVLLLVLIVLAANGRPADAVQATAGDSAAPRQQAPAARAEPPSPDSALWLEMRNVDLHIDRRGVLHVERLRGQVLPTKPGETPVLDDTRSFSVRVTSGRVALTGEDLSILLNGYVFNYPGAPLKRLRVRTAGSQLVQTGVLHKGVDVRFEITSTLSLEPDGRVRLHPTRTRILGIDGARLLRALGLRLDDLLDLRGARGASVRGNDLFLEPTKILPPPAISGRLASIRVEGDRIVQTFVRVPDDAVFDSYVRADSAAPNFVYFRGARLRFGKLLMTDTDLQIVDAEQRDPFDLYLAEYNRQLVASESRTLPNLGLKVLMPDYRTIAAPRPTVAARPVTPH